MGNSLKVMDVKTFRDTPGWRTPETVDASELMYEKKWSISIFFHFNADNKHTFLQMCAQSKISQRRFFFFFFF